MCLDDFIWFDRHSFSIIFGIWESFMDHLGVGLFVCLFVCLSVCLSFCLSVCLRMFGRHFYHISGVVSEHFCSWAGLIFQDNFCHGLDLLLFLLIYCSTLLWLSITRIFMILN